MKKSSNSAYTIWITNTWTTINTLHSITFPSSPPPPPHELLLIMSLFNYSSYKHNLTFLLGKILKEFLVFHWTILQLISRSGGGTEGCKESVGLGMIQHVNLSGQVGMKRGSGGGTEGSKSNVEYNSLSYQGRMGWKRNLMEVLKWVSCRIWQEKCRMW